MIADKRRIDACLKACEGISTQNLEDNVPFLELARRYNALLHDNTALQAKVAEMEKQGPAGIAGSMWAMPGTSGFTVAYFSADEVPVGTKLYLAPGAKGE